MSDDVLRSFPLGFPWPTIDPFLFCAYHDDAYPAGNEAMGPSTPLDGRRLGEDFEPKDGWRMYHGTAIPGFPRHPHRGFETVTVVRRGTVDHSDSLGATARLGSGDVQWMTAGRGIVHAEMFPLLDRAAPNPLELFQVWLNLPRRDKLADPHFAMFWAESVPRLRLEARGGAVDVTVCAGELGGRRAPPPPPRSWAASPESDVAIWTIRVDAGAAWTLPPASGPATGRTLYFHRGTRIRLAGTTIDAGNAAVVRADRPIEIAAVGSAADLLLLQGRPIGEPVAPYGPFVMSTREEILRAFDDYRRTEFGGWPWPSDGPTHPREAGRFARHADGRIERPT